MEFFIPDAPSDEEAETFYGQVKDYNVSLFGRPIKERRIFSVTFWDNGIKYTAEVGKAIHGKDLVLAILDSGESYLICSNLAGSHDGTPLRAFPSETVSLIEFD